MSTNPIPLISVVTIVRNCRDAIEGTMLSVLSQTYGNIEYIVVDGASTDGTWEVITNYELRIKNGEFPNVLFHCASGPDKGIYDAMNKGIALAHGSYINFMNAGDIFADNYVIQNVIDMSNPEADIIYGNVIVVDKINQISKAIQAKPVSKIWKGMIFSHQSVFIKQEKIQQFPFKLQYKIAADYDQIFNLYKNGCTFQYLSIAIAKTTIGGISYSNITTTREQIKIVYAQRHNIFDIFPFLPFLLIDLIRRIFGKKITSLIRRLKWKIT